MVAKKIRQTLLAAAGLILPVLSQARSYGPPKQPPPGVLAGDAPIRQGQDVLDLLNVFARWISYGFWVLGFIFVLLAAFQYFTSAGNPEKVKEANKRLLWAFIAIAVGLMAYGARTFVYNVLISRY